MSLKDKLSNVNISEILKTSRGKGITAGLLLVFLLLVVLVIVTFALPKPGNQAVNVVGKSAVPSPAPQPATPPAASQPTVKDSDIIATDYDLFEFKDPFRPLAMASTDDTLTVDDSNGSGTDSDGQGSAGDAPDVDSLSLVEIIEQNGEKYAIVLYRGQEFTVKEGEQIGDSPFRVTDIGDGSISLLYGDDRLTLQLGQGIVK